jgi:hypothetical protein
VLDGLRSTKAGSSVLREITPAPGLGGDMIAERLPEDLGSLENPLWLVIDDVHELGSGEALRELALFAMRSAGPASDGAVDPARLAAGPSPLASGERVDRDPCGRASFLGVRRAGAV